MTVHLLATHVETGEEYVAVLEYGDYCLVTHGGSFDVSVLPTDYRSVPLSPASPTSLPGGAGLTPDGPLPSGPADAVGNEKKPAGDLGKGLPVTPTASAPLDSVDDSDENDVGRQLSYPLGHPLVQGRTVPGSVIAISRTSPAFAFIAHGLPKLGYLGRSLRDALSSRGPRRAHEHPASRLRTVH